MIIKYYSPQDGDGSQAEWKNIIQRHLEIKENESPEVVWPESLLLEYYSSLIQLQENLAAQKEILKLLNITLLKILE